MTIGLWAALHREVKLPRIHAQGVECPYPSACAIVLSAMREAVGDIYLRKAKLPIRQVSMLVPAESWDRWSIDLPPRFKELRAGKLDRVLMLFECNSDATLFAKGGRFSLLWHAR